MSLFGIFGKVKPIPPKTTSTDKNSQTDFDFDEEATDGINIGIRVDPRPGSGRPRSRSRSKTPDTKDPENMLMAEKVFYGQTDQDEWNVSAVSHPAEEEQPFSAVEKPRDPCCKDPCNDPCVQKYVKCVQHCLAVEEEHCKTAPEHKHEEGSCAVEEEKTDVREGRSGRRPCNDPCRSTSRGREEKQRSQKGDKPRRQCSDLCRVTKKKQEPTEEKITHHNDPCADPCPPKDPCADPCAKTDPGFDPESHAIGEDHSGHTDPCADPCHKNKQHSSKHHGADPSHDPCADPCQPKNPCPPKNPCCLLDPCHPKGENHHPDSCDTHHGHGGNGHTHHGHGGNGHTHHGHGGNGHGANGHGGNGHGGNGHAAPEADHPVCPVCPPCPPCPPCPECPACPACPSPTGTNKGYRPCNTSSPTSVKEPVSEVSSKSPVSDRGSPVNLSKSQEEGSKSVCPDPLFPSCKPSEESCQSIVCPEDS